MDMAFESWTEQDFCLASHPLSTGLMAREDLRCQELNIIKSYDFQRWQQLILNNQDLTGSGFRTHTWSESDVVEDNHRVIETLKCMEILIIPGSSYSLKRVNTLKFVLPKTFDKGYSLPIPYTC